VLLERTCELETLWGVVEAGGVAVVEGEAGIGKTSLLEATGARAAEAGARVLRARGTALERGYGFGIVRQLFEREVDDGLTGPAATALGRPDEPVGADGAFAVQHGLYLLARDLAEPAPAVLLVDDAQWADVPSLRWLTYLAGRLDGVDLAVLAAWRTGEADAPETLLEALRAEPATRTVTPPALDAHACAALLREALGAEPDPALVADCQRCTGGNPFLLRALADTLRDGAAGGGESRGGEAHRGVSRGGDGRGGGVPVAEVGPEAVRRQVLLRLAHLGADAAALARAVAVLDADAEPRFAFALAGLGRTTGERAAAALEAARLLDVGDALRFAHPILRAAVYQELPVAARAGEHRRAAEVLREDPDRAAVHLLASLPAGDEEVVEQLLRAAERAEARGAPEAALALVERALDEPVSTKRRPALLLTAGRLARILARPDARSLLAEAHLHAGDDRVRSAAAAELAHTLFHGRPDEGAQVLRRALEAAPDERLHLNLLTLESTSRLRCPEAVERDIAALLERPPPARTGAAALALWHRELWDEAPRPVGELAALLDEHEALIDAYGPDFAPLTLGASILAEWDGLERADAIFAAVLDAARRTGNAFAHTLAAASRAIHLTWCGAFDDAEAHARATLERAQATGTWSGTRSALGSLTWALTGRGAYAEIDALLARHGLTHDAGVSPLIDGSLLVARSLLRRGQGRLAEARADAERALDLVRPANPLNRVTVWCARVLDDADRAQRAVVAARASGLSGVLGIALHSSGLVERSPERLREAADVLATTPWRWEEAEALVDLGAALRRANRRVEAREPLRRGLELGQRIGALAAAERAREELVATGARPRTPAGALTVSERRVARRAAEGATIAEIAEALFVTRKTIETHLYSAYRKLDVSSRAELATALDVRA